MFVKYGEKASLNLIVVSVSITEATQSSTVYENNWSWKDIHGSDLAQFLDILVHLHEASFVGNTRITQWSRSLFHPSRVSETGQEWKQRISKMLRRLHSNIWLVSLTEWCLLWYLYEIICKELRSKHTSLGSSVGRQSTAMNSIPPPSISSWILSFSGLYLKDEQIQVV